MHVDTLFITLVIGLGVVASRSLWHYRLNPISIGIIAWTPAIVLTTIPYEFVMPIYDHLNYGPKTSTIIAMLISFICFSTGVLTVRMLFGARKWDDIAQQHSALSATNNYRLSVLFIIGLAVFLYAFSRSGLIGVMELSPDEIFESRLALHLGPISNAVIFLDITSVVFLAKMLESRRPIYALPMIITVLCYMATLQKSRVVFMGLSALFVLLLYPVAAREIAFGNIKRRVITLFFCFLLVSALFVMNSIRGIGLVSYTTFGSAAVEQSFIYSGATAILNLAAAIEGQVPSDPPTRGMILLRPILWHFVDRDLLNPTKYFEGINAATYLIYPWGDFRWLGFFLVPFLTGAIITVFMRTALSKTTLGLMLGSIGFTAIVFSVNTDVIFDPTTLAIITMTVLAHLFVRTKQPYSYRKHSSNPSNL